MHPTKQIPVHTTDQLEEQLNPEWNDNFDIKIRSYSEYSDHYDPNHYDFYDRYMGQFILGMYRLH